MGWGGLSAGTFRAIRKWWGRTCGVGARSRARISYTTPRPRTGKRSADLPDVPALVELGKSAEDRQVLSFYVSGAEVGRSILTTPGVPADRLEALRRAFDAMLKDKDFLADIEKSGSDLEPATGEE